MRAIPFVVLLFGCGPSATPIRAPTFEEQAAKHPRPPADVSLKPAGAGWYCTTRPGAPEIDREPEPEYAPCFRSQAECDAVVNVNDVTRKVNSPCEAATTASCFTHQRGRLEREGVVDLTASYECMLTEHACDAAANDLIVLQVGFGGPEGNPVKNISPCTSWD